MNRLVLWDLWKPLDGVRHRAATAGASVISRFRSICKLPNAKIFVIGRNKTGTTSIKAALRRLGYRLGQQRRAELLTIDWGQRDFRALVAFIHTADAFQDVPFSYDFTFQAVDQAFPGSRFILSVRDSEEQWYQSLVRFHSRRLKGRFDPDSLPTWEDIRRDSYVHDGWTFRNQLLIHGSNVLKTDPWDEARWKQYYRSHNQRVIDYFRNRPDDLLVLNVGHPDSMRQLCKFLGKKYDGEPMPRKNQSQ